MGLTMGLHVSVLRSWSVNEVKWHPVGNMKQNGVMFHWMHLPHVVYGFTSLWALGLFLSLGFINYVHIHISQVEYLQFFEHTSRHSVKFWSGQQATCVLNFLRTGQSVSHSGSAIPHLLSNAWGFQCLPSLSNAFYSLVFFSFLSSHPHGGEMHVVLICNSLVIQGVFGIFTHVRMICPGNC